MSSREETDFMKAVPLCKMAEKHHGYTRMHLLICVVGSHQFVESLRHMV